MTIHAGAVVIAALQPEEPPVDLGPWSGEFTEVTFEAAAPEPPGPSQSQEEPLPPDPPPAPVEPPEFVEEKAHPAPIRPMSNAPVGPIGRPRTVGGPTGSGPTGSGSTGSGSTGSGHTGSMTMSSARALVISGPRPKYPYEARRGRITGSGIVVLTVDPSSGAVTSAILAQSTGSAVLDDAATSAFRVWRFKPGTVSKVRTPITFTMEGAQF